VKRYSSGMYVRLAFAVAAHLEPEILIVDEVLAVGDAEFQKKCLGKMKAITDIGRTILFVSHNMTAVTTLCTRCLYLREGKVEATGDVESIIGKYLTLENTVVTEKIFSENEKPGDENARLRKATIINPQYQPINQIYVDQSFGIEIEFEVLANEMFSTPNVHLHTIKNEYVLASSFPELQKFEKGIHRAVVWIPSQLLNTGTYTFNIAFTSLNPTKVHFNAKECLVFEVYEDMKNRNLDFNRNFPGIIHPHLKWEINK
jgi:lipopolysaccharide transport system ATP-binding protein